MGNFEKLGILVIIVLVVVIIVVAAVGMDDPPRTEQPLAAATTGGGGDRTAVEPDPIVRPDPIVTPVDPVPPPDPIIVPPTPEPTKYTVKKGDSLWKIAVKVFGPNKGHLYKKILAANPGLDEGALKIGLVLIIPALEAAPRVTPNRTPAVASGQRKYRIKDGDKLWNIARKTLGSGARYTEILELNPGLNANNLPIGKEILLPST